MRRVETRLREDNNFLDEHRAGALSGLGGSMSRASGSSFLKQAPLDRDASIGHEAALARHLFHVVHGLNRFHFAWMQEAAESPAVVATLNRRRKDL